MQLEFRMIPKLSSIFYLIFLTKLKCKQITIYNKYFTKFQSWKEIIYITPQESNKLLHILNGKRIQKKVLQTFYTVKYNMQCIGFRKENYSKTSMKYNIISEK